MIWNKSQEHGTFLIMDFRETVLIKVCFQKEMILTYKYFKFT